MTGFKGVNCTVIDDNYTFGGYDFVIYTNSDYNVVYLRLSLKLCVFLKSDKEGETNK